MVIELGNDGVAALRAAGRSVGAGELILVGDELPFRQHELLREAFPDSRFVSASSVVMPQRLRKDDREIEAIERAGALSVAALEDTLSHFGPEFTRLDFVAELRHQLLRHGSEGLSYEPDIFVAGDGAAFAWCEDCRGRPQTAVRAPACMAVDWGGIYMGYRADVGRTVYCGEPSAEQVRALRAVHNAQQAAITALVPGAACGYIDDVARTIMEDAGLGAEFRSTTGHGIGLEVHEPPRLLRGLLEPLPASSVLTIEIGAWRDGELAVFWEDEVMTTPAGGRLLTPHRGEAYRL
jgi:Xaa-Pro aminopeptidase